MSMSKKDYEAIAAAIKSTHEPWPANVAYRSAAAHTANAVLPHLCSSNLAFNPQTFLKACGLTPATDAKGEPGRSTWYGV